MSEWSELEVELIVEDYFQMLSKELASKKYSKTEHRRNLLPLLSNRSEGSIEFKHQNISAVLINLGQLYIKGYLPRFNYQGILEEKVINYLYRNKSIELIFQSYVKKNHSLPGNYNFQKMNVEAPLNTQVTEPSPFYKRSPIKINFLEREQTNSKLGNLGEQLVLEYEKWNLLKLGKEQLSEEVRWISKEEGDGAGFYILSRNLDGSDRYVEVKTTTLGKETPFFFSRNELLFSEEKSTNFHLCRVFNFEKNPQLFFKEGSLKNSCHYIPINYQGYF